MSYPAIFPNVNGLAGLPSFSPASDTAATPRQSAVVPPVGSLSPSPGLLAWARLRLQASAQRFQARQNLRPSLRGGETLCLDVYRACASCSSASAGKVGMGLGSADARFGSSARLLLAWCGDGVAEDEPFTLPAALLAGPAAPALRAVPAIGSRDEASHAELEFPGRAPLSITLGSQVDPYSPAEAAQGRTRSLLRLLASPRAGADAAQLRQFSDAATQAGVGSALAAADFALSILTRSPLLLRDLDLLIDLDQRHVVTLGVLLPTTDPKLLRRLEPASWPSSASSASCAPSSASPFSSFASTTAASRASIEERLHMVSTLSAQGIATHIVCSPILPGVNNSFAALDALFSAAREAGASDVLPAPHHPNHPPTAIESAQLLALFYRLRLQHGFPRTLPSRA